MTQEKSTAIREAIARLDMTEGCKQDVTALVESVLGEKLLPPNIPKVGELWMHSYGRSNYLRIIDQDGKAAIGGINKDEFYSVELHTGRIVRTTVTESSRFDIILLGSWPLQKPLP